MLVSPAARSSPSHHESTVKTTGIPIRNPLAKPPHTRHRTHPTMRVLPRSRWRTPRFDEHLTPIGYLLSAGNF